MALMDTTKIKLQLKLTNYAESQPESKTRLQVRRISYLVTILDVDDVAHHEQLVSDKYVPEFQAELNWQAGPGQYLQDDLQVQTTLTQLSEKLCPCRNIATSLYDHVKSDDVVVGGQSSSYRHLSFRSTMLTRHSGEGQPELLFQHDGLSGEQSNLRWRSHDYIKVTLRQPRPWFYVFWLFQWDIVDLQPHINEIISRHEQAPRSIGVRQVLKRKSPWIAEVRRKGERRKLWLGNYRTKEAALRAADAGRHYYHNGDRLNFPKSPQYLPAVPPDLTAEDKEKFVKQEARCLASRAEELRQPYSLQPAPLGGVPQEISNSDNGPQDFGLMFLQVFSPNLLCDGIWPQGDWPESSPGDSISADSDHDSASLWSDYS